MKHPKSYDSTPETRKRMSKVKLKGGKTETLLAKELWHKAYKEIIEDQHPIVVISGRDIVEILLGAGVGSVEHLRDWLKANF